MSPPFRPGRRPGARPTGPPDIGAQVEGAIRSALEAVLPDAERSFWVDRLNERYGDGTVVDGVQTPLARLQPTIAAGSSAVVSSYRVPSQEGRFWVREWWHGIELDGVASPTRAQLNAAWEATRTHLEINGQGVPHLFDLAGQRTDNLRPAEVAIRVRTGNEFAIRMSVDAGYVGPSILANAGFRGHSS